MQSQLYHVRAEIFWEMHGWYLLHTAAPEQMFKSENNPWRFQGRMKNCAGASTPETIWVTKLMVIKVCPRNLGGCVGLPAQDRFHCWGLGI